MSERTPLYFTDSLPQSRVNHRKEYNQVAWVSQGCGVRPGRGEAGDRQGGLSLALHPVRMFFPPRLAVFLYYRWATKLNGLGDSFDYNNPSVSGVVMNWLK